MRFNRFRNNIIHLLDYSQFQEDFFCTSRYVFMTSLLNDCNFEFFYYCKEVHLLLLCVLCVVFFIFLK